MHWSLPPRTTAFVEYQSVLATLPNLSRRTQNRRLKVELFHAIERAHTHQDRARAFEAQAILGGPLSDASTLRTLHARCTELETLCRELLATLEQAALAEAQADTPIDSASVSGLTEATTG